MCKHYLSNGECPLKQYCQFAHGPNELRQSNDPLPNNFGKTALGAVHSNYKTQACKIFYETGECKFGEGCSFFHNDGEKRKLIDPLPNLPEGVTLPPMPEKLKNYKQKKAAGYNYDGAEGSSQNGPQFFSPIQNAMPMFTISNLTDIMALGGFNPNKYLTPQPMPAVGINYQNYGQVPPHMLHQQQPGYGNPQPFNGQMPPPPGTNSAQRPQKQNSGQNDKKSEKKEKKKGGNQEKKYVSKQASPKKDQTAQEAK